MNKQLKQCACCGGWCWSQVMERDLTGDLLCPDCYVICGQVYEGSGPVESWVIKHIPQPLLGVAAALMVAFCFSALLAVALR